MFSLLFAYPTLSLSPVTTVKVLKKCVLCAYDMKIDVIQAYELTLHALIIECKHFNPERFGESVKS